MCHGGQDHALHRVKIVERLAALHGYPRINRQRAFCWFRAARAAYRERNWAECRRRAARALRLAPWHLRAACLWASAGVRMLASS